MGRKNFLAAALITFAVLIFITAPKIHGGQSIRGLIDIGLAINQPEISLTLNGTETILDLSQSSPRSLYNPGDQDLVSCCGEILCLNDIPISTGPLLVIPGADILTWNSRNYRGSFLIAAQNGKLNLINRLQVEEYLPGVVPREVIAGWPMAVLKAQAIAARTYTLASLQRHQDNHFDLCPYDHCQVYGGASAEQPTTNQAVTETEGQVITYKGKIIDAFYHAASGGFTEDALNIWNNSVPYLKPVLDWDQNSPHTQWTRTFNWTELQVMTQVAYPRIGRLKQLLPVTFDKNSRVMRLLLKGDLDEVSLTGVQFRSMTGIPSANIQLTLIYGPEPYITLWWLNQKLFPYPEVLTARNDIPGLTAEILNPPWDQPDPWAWLQDKEPVKLIIRGAGWGHGVGLSQWGAKGMADAGFNERQIIAHYYPGTVITNIDKLK
jgi:stage II sporulation protein D